MKLDREKFLAAAMLISATNATVGCCKSESAEPDQATKAGTTPTVQVPVNKPATTAKPTTNPVAEAAPPAPVKEAPPAPVKEALPTATTTAPKAPIRIPGKK